MADTWSDLAHEAAASDDPAKEPRQRGYTSIKPLKGATDLSRSLQDTAIADAHDAMGNFLRSAGSRHWVASPAGFCN